MKIISAYFCFGEFLIFFIKPELILIFFFTVDLDLLKSVHDRILKEPHLK